MLNLVKTVFPGKRSIVNFVLVALCSQLMYAVLGLKVVAIQQMQTIDRKSTRLNSSHSSTSRMPSSA